jgi:AraC-like DNA-binding protein
MTDSSQASLSWPSPIGGRAFSLVDPDEAHQVIADAYSPSMLRLNGPSDDFFLKLRMTRLPGLSLGRTRFGGDVQVAAPPPSIYVVCLASKGALEVRSGRHARVVTGASGAISDPQQMTYFEKWSSGAELLSLRVEQVALERKLAQLTGRTPTEPIRFQFALDSANRQSASLMRALRMLRAETSEPGGLSADPVAATALTDLVVTSLLVCQPNNYSELLHEAARPTPPGTIRNAQDLIESDPMAVGTVGELAAHVHVSVRSLEEGFQRYLDTTPMSYLRRVRLDRARAELALADPREQTVAAVARRWGFQHLGRFAQVYREQFGELPTETLKASIRPRTDRLR